MTLHLRPVTRGNLASQVIDGMLAGPGSEWHRDHAGAAVANLAELRSSCLRHRLYCRLRS